MKDIDLAIAQGEELGVPLWLCEADRFIVKRDVRRRWGPQLPNATSNPNRVRDAEDAIAGPR
jgi:hypothetical protein